MGKPPFVPQIWATEALEVLRSSVLYGPDDNPKHIYVDEPLDPDFLAAREAFRERWDTMIAEGEAAGFLERETCYECPGEQYVPDNTDRRVARPNPDYDPDKKADGRTLTVTIPAHQANHVIITTGDPE